ncbi:MAG: glutamate racemase [Clostridia bacterium]|nr:glutamate racemase [Clostridia bacterium]
MAMDKNAPVGVFDSGVGGISVLASLRKELPGEDYLYYGDTLHAPYGTRPSEEVCALAEAAFLHLTGSGCKAVVIACNTATAAAAAFLRGKYPDRPILGMEPALKPAALNREDGAILVLATPTTLRLGKFRHLMEQYGEAAVPVPCPGLMELVEQRDKAAQEAYLQRLLSPWESEPLDAVVLGCTHYTFLVPILRRLLPPAVKLYDGNAGTARQLRCVLTRDDLLRPRSEGGTVRLESSDPDPGVLTVMRGLLDEAAAGPVLA